MNDKELLRDIRICLWVIMIILILGFVGVISAIKYLV